MAWLAAADQKVTAESGVTRYLEEIRRVPELSPNLGDGRGQAAAA
jgi:hypothetical protein